MHKRICLILISTLLCSYIMQAQVTIGINKKPMAGALLDLKDQEDGSAKKGLLLPRLMLKNLDVLQVGGINDDSENQYIKHAGMMVYNLPDDPVCPSILAGVYTWSGSQWIPAIGKEKKTDITPNNPGTSTDPFAGANSYVMGVNERISIPVKRAFQIWREYKSAGATPTEAEINEGKVLNLASVNNLTGKISASIAWQEDIDGLDKGCVIEKSVIIDNENAGENAHVIVESMGARGNALVRAHIGANGDKTDPVLWQWHIWVPDGDPTAPDAKVYSHSVGDAGNSHVFEFMDRALGAMDNTYRVLDKQDPSTWRAYGLYFQWGRPTPFRKNYSQHGTRATESTQNDRKEANNLTRALQNSYVLTTVYNAEPNNTTNTMDWYSYSSNLPAANIAPHSWSTRWDKDGNKTPLDPCPIGWRVPSYHNDLSPWEKLTTTPPSGWENGYHFDYTSNNNTFALGYWPAGGLLTANVAGIASQDEIGVYWTGTISTEPAVLGKGRVAHLYISKNYPPVSSRNFNGIANNFNVRCVKE